VLLPFVLAADVPVGEAEGDALAEPVGKIPTPGDAEPEGFGEADAVGDVWAFTRDVAVAADVVNKSTPVVNMSTETTASARGIVLRMGPPFLSLIPCPV
jgi:hypothetical protein